jgi:hypothetical protein
MSAERRSDEKNQYVYQLSAIANCFIWLFRGDTSDPDSLVRFLLIAGKLEPAEQVRNEHEIT